MQPGEKEEEKARFEREEEKARFEREEEKPETYFDGISFAVILHRYTQYTIQKTRHAALLRVGFFLRRRFLHDFL